MIKRVINQKTDYQFNIVKFWRELDARLAKMGKKRVWLSEVTPIKKSTINNWVSEERWPSVIALYHFSKVLETTMRELLENSIDETSTTTKKKSRE